MTLVTNQDLGKVIDARPGKTAATLTGFFDDLGAQRCRQIEAVSADMEPAYLKAIREAPHVDATVCIDPFHVMLNANKALDMVRRGYWNELRERARPDDARRFKHARCALLKRPEHLTTPRPSSSPRSSGPAGRCGGPPGRAGAEGDLPSRPGPRRGRPPCGPLPAWAPRSRLPSFVKLGRTIRKHRAGILAALGIGINNGRSQGLNTKVRRVASRAYGFHSAAAMVMLTCGPVTITVPHQRRPNQ